MRITQPLDPFLTRPRKILLAGCGGGYDVFGAVPLVVEWMQAGHEVHLANLTFCAVERLPGAMPHEQVPNLYSVGAQAATESMYCPEAWLARWMEEKLGVERPVWCFQKTGARPLAQAYQALIDELGIDTVVLVDGGVDSILRGDEVSLGTPAEDLVTLAALQRVKVEQAFVVCVGMGAEMRDGISHAQVLERIAALTSRDAFFGVTSMLKMTEAGAHYLDAVAYTFAGQATQRQSHIHKVISAAMNGEFGATAPHVWLSPILPMYWYFDYSAIAQDHLFLQHLVDTDEIWQVTLLVEGLRKGIAVRARDPIPM